MDVLRIISCFLVLLAHCNLQLYPYIAFGTTKFISIGIHTLSRISVPAFIMVTGALSLGKIYPYKKVAKKILRTVLVIVMISFVYYISLYGLTHFNPLSFIASIYSSHISPCLWYMYLYLGLLLMLPFLQRLCINMKAKDYYVFFGISFGFVGLSPIIEHFFQGFIYSDKLNLAIFNIYIAYFIAGYYIDNFIKPTKKLCIIALIVMILSLSATWILTYYEMYTGINPDAPSTWGDFGTWLCIIPSICFYILIKGMMNRNIRKHTAHILREIGACTFCTYLLGDLVIRVFQPLYVICQRKIYILISLIIYSICVTLTGLLLSWILRKIPGIKKLI